jgi:putative component of membrane protein insertase Oxa1/YidC/SpoIIIJ protein YidD
LKLLIVIFSIGINCSFAQTDFVKWEKSDYRYEITTNHQQRNYNFNAGSVGEFILKTFTNTYWFFISDVDGDNCPFRPSCSHFLVEAVHETDIFQGTVMFFDRFTRDMNIFKHNHYPRVKAGYYYDPPQLYTLNKNQIEYISPSAIVDDE